jgi:hypothetical protein
MVTLLNLQALLKHNNIVAHQYHRGALEPFEFLGDMGTVADVQARLDAGPAWCSSTPALSTKAPIFPVVSSGYWAMVRDVKKYSERRFVAQWMFHPCERSLF